MTDEKKDQFELEDTPEVSIGNGNVGMLWKVVTAILVVICIYYFFTHLKRPKPEPADKKPPVTETKK